MIRPLAFMFAGVFITTVAIQILTINERLSKLESQAIELSHIESLREKAIIYRINQVKHND